MVYEIREKDSLKNFEGDLVQMLKTRFKNKSGIIYCISRKDCEKLSETLQKNYSLKVAYYHAELEYSAR